MNIGDLIVIGLILGFVVILIYAGYYELNLKMQSLDRFDVLDIYEGNEMEKLVREAINSLPKKCRAIFLLSRMEGLKYREISERLGISVNTVECQMGIALKKLRVMLNMRLAA